MKKLVLTLCFCALCAVGFAAPADDLAAEEPMARTAVEVLLGKTPYKSVEKSIDPRYAKELSEEAMKKGADGIQEIYGNPTNIEMVAYLRDGAHRVGYLVEFPQNRKIIVMTLFQNGKVAGLQVQELDK